MKPAAIADIEARTPSKRVLTSTPSGRLELQRSCETECCSARTPMIMPYSASSECKKQYTRFSGNIKIRYLLAIFFSPYFYILFPENFLIGTIKIISRRTLQVVAFFLDILKSSFEHLCIHLINIPF